MCQAPRHHPCKQERKSQRTFSLAHSKARARFIERALAGRYQALLHEVAMRFIRPTSILASAALFGAPFYSANAIERNLLTWSGKVDREVLIQIRGRDVATRGSGLDATYSPRVNLKFALPRAAGVVRVVREGGRGDVDVLENPSARNNYTATVRVRDSRAGADNYRIVLTFEANDIRVDPGSGRNGGNDNRGNDNRGNDNRGNRGNDDRNNRGNDDRNNRGNDDRNNRGNDDRNNRNDRGNDDYDRGRRDAGALRWSGLVDGVAEIRIQGGRIDALAAQGNNLRNVRYDIVGASLPRRDVRLEMARQEGRGNVSIVQQPSVWNGYVAIVRIDDGRRGYGAYSFDIRW